MEWSNTLTVSRLFLTHDIDIIGPNHASVIVHIPSLREYLDQPFYNQFISLFSDEQMGTWKKIVPNLDKGTLLQMLMTTPALTNLKEFNVLSHSLHEHISLILPKFNIRERKLYSDDTLLTVDAIDELLFVLQQGLGKRVERPQHFGPDEEAARQFYERAKAAKAKAEKIRSEAQNSSGDGLISMFTMITYRFPYTFEQLYDMTLMQLYYLQSTASAMLGYEHGMTAYLTGNAKKAPKFFLK